jgi:hypothetical protein
MNQVKSINKNERAVLVISNMVTYGRSDLQRLYQFIERSGVAIAETILRPRYKTYRTLIQKQATFQATVDTLMALISDDSIQAIDLVLNLHGDEKILCFEDGTVHTGRIKKELLNLNAKNKLRMVYSTCCYGESHAEDFIASGFKAASGAVATNADAATEYPVFLTLWAAGRKFKDAVGAGNNPITRIPQDRAAKALGFDDADSHKVIVGDGTITIKSGI